MIREVAGRQNHSVKLARKLQKKKHRRERGLLVCEGLDLLRAAVEAKAEVRDVLVRSDLLDHLPTTLVERASAASAEDGSVDVGVCDAETLDYASSLGGAADVVFSCTEPAWSLSDLELDAGVSLFLDGVGDPGNVGTLVRSVVAFGGVGVICSPGSADPYSPKAMRAGMGAQFIVPVVTEVTVAQLIARLSAMEGRGARVPEIVVTDPHDGEDVRSLRTDRGVVVVLGAERNGAGDEWPGARRVCISQRRFDSLNVAMAGTIVAYELCRRDCSIQSGK